ncbi:hypothetical protein ASL22_13170 [Alcaligenes faecalis]|nr:hypothetical protein ASL22_13170 [Alcaligenes faecalis]
MRKLKLEILLSLAFFIRLWPIGLGLGVLSMTLLDQTEVDTLFWVIFALLALAYFVAATVEFVCEHKLKALKEVTHE